MDNMFSAAPTNIDNIPPSANVDKFELVETSVNGSIALSIDLAHDSDMDLLAKMVDNNNSTFETPSGDVPLSISIPTPTSPSNWPNPTLLESQNISNITPTVPTNISSPLPSGQTNVSIPRPSSQTNISNTTPTVPSKISNTTPLISGPVKTHRLYVGGVPRSITEEDLREYFLQFGPVFSCFLKESKVTNRSRGFGFFVVAEEVVDAIFRSAPHFVKGKEVFVKEAYPTGSSRIPRPQYRRVFVGGLPQEICEWDLFQLFSRFGRVETVQIFWDKIRSKYNQDASPGQLDQPDVVDDQRSRRHRGFGFVTFVDNLYAEAVVRQRYFFLEAGVWINEASRLIETRMASSNYANRYAAASSNAPSSSRVNRTTSSSSSFSSDSVDDASEDRRVVVMSPPIHHPQLREVLEKFGPLESLVNVRPGFDIVTFERIPVAKMIDNRGYIPLDAFQMATVELFRKRGLRLPWPQVAPITPTLSPVDSLPFWDEGLFPAPIRTISTILPTSTLPSTPTLPPTPTLPSTPALPTLTETHSTIGSFQEAQPSLQHMPHFIDASHYHSLIHLPLPPYPQQHLPAASHLQHSAYAMSSPNLRPAPTDGSFVMQQSSSASVFFGANLNPHAHAFVPPMAELQDCSTCPKHGSTVPSDSESSSLQVSQTPEIASPKDVKGPTSLSAPIRRRRVAGE